MFTSYFAQVPNIEYPVSIARINPEWYDRAVYPKLAPSKELLYDFKYGVHRGDKDFYTDVFLKYLDTLDFKEVMSELSAIYGPDVLDRLTLLCYEKPSDFCHRHLVANWLTQHGADISECKFNELPNIIDDVLDLM